MEGKFTDEDLILFYYGEASQEKAFLIQNTLEESYALQEVYTNLTKPIQVLDEFSKEPHPSSVDIILEHSDHLSSLETH